MPEGGFHILKMKARYRNSNGSDGASGNDSGNSHVFFPGKYLIIRPCVVSEYVLSERIPADSQAAPGIKAFFAETISGSSILPGSSEKQSENLHQITVCYKI